ncbi:MAG TPA: MXAN_6640 family putative metalloprotease [Acidobacteriota bacterium]|nr:MXAN_6640 family putative metalloprotease [Acidobacteriota bacterium]
MNRAFFLLTILLHAATVHVAAETLSLERQREIIELYQYVTGQRERLPAALAQLDEEQRPPIRCGTIAILDFLDNYDRLDPTLLASLGVTTPPRPVLDSTYDTPSGMIRLHYSADGIDKVRFADVDVNGNGVPDYVEKVAGIADSVYDFTVNVLKYPPPLPDTACSNGGDARVDIYIRNLGSDVFGLTWADTACSEDPDLQFVPGWIEIDNDFVAVSAYRDRPLDAVRVTLAHEFFHAVHFTLDYTESREIVEMTAVWMEEQQYDEINDYYTLLPYFFNPISCIDAGDGLECVRHPGRSLQSQVQYHHYASVLFPIFLTEAYGRDIVRHMWIRSGELGPGTHWLQAVEEALDSATGHYVCDSGSFDTVCHDSSWAAESFASAVQDFAVWNYFTGPYSDQAPNGIGYSERHAYPTIPVEQMLVVNTYGDTLLNDSNPLIPEVNGIVYVRFEDIPTIITDYWVCDSGSFDSVCYDSSNVIDTVFNVWASLSRRPEYWGAAFILQMVNNPDSHEVLSTIIPGDGDLFADIPGTPRYNSITMALTPTAVDPMIYFNGPAAPFGYALWDDWSLPIPPDPALVNLPAALLVPYPNPAVVSGHGPQAADSVTFRLEIPTDSQAGLAYLDPYYQVDLYTVAGELIRTIKLPVSGEQLDRYTGPPVITYSTGWDMKNENGDDVASGVYLVYAHLYSDVSRKTLLAEDRTKVVVLR